MLSSLLKYVGGWFDKRFFFNVWAPTFLFCAAGVIVAAAAAGPQAAVKMWADLPAPVQAWLGAGSLVAITFLAYVCNSFLDGMVRLYEGYWPNWAQWASHRAIALSQRQQQFLSERLDLLTTRRANLEQAIRRANHFSASPSAGPRSEKGLEELVQHLAREFEQLPLTDQEERSRKLLALFSELEGLRNTLHKSRDTSAAQDKWQQKETELVNTFVDLCDQEEKRLKHEYDGLYWRFYVSFPKQLHLVMPTRLGNVLQAVEEYGDQVYHLDVATVWPRLVQQLPAEFKVELERSMTPLVAMLFSSTLAGLWAIAGGLVLALAGGPWKLLLGVVIGGLLLAWLCYESAVQRAAEYGFLMRAAFDLHRLHLLQALHMPLPASPRDEQLLWQRLAQWCYFYRPPWDLTTGKPEWYYQNPMPLATNLSMRSASSNGPEAETREEPSQ